MDISNLKNEPSFKEIVDPEFEVKKELQEKRKEIKSFEELTAFLKDVSDNYDIGYGSDVRAIGQALLATAYYLGRQFGITGFQASCIMWEFTREWTDIGAKVGAKLINYDNMLYPQYRDEFEFKKVISQSIWEALQKEAKKHLENDTQHASPAVIAHWKSIADGKVPFGYTVKKDAKKAIPIDTDKWDT